MVYTKGILLLVPLVACASVVDPERGPLSQPAPLSSDAPLRRETVRERERREQTEEMPRIDERRERIKSEIEQLASRADLASGHWARAWAGEYRGSLGVSVASEFLVAPSSGITSRMSTCYGFANANHGDIEGPFDDDGDGTIDGIIVKWRLAQALDEWNACSPRLYFVAFADKTQKRVVRLVVPEHRMPALMNMINRTGSSSGVDFAVRLVRDPVKADLDLPEKYEPQMSARWKKYILRAPLQARVVSVADNSVPAAPGQQVSVRRATLTLDRGKADGVYEGLECRVADDAGGVLTVTKVEDHTSEARYTVYVTRIEHPRSPVAGDVIRLAEGIEIDRREKPRGAESR